MAQPLASMHEPDRRRRWWHSLSLVASAAIVAALLPACADRHVDCTSAEEGDRCDSSVQTACANGLDITGTEGTCSGCMLSCRDGTWRELCSEPQTCPAEPPEEGSACNPFCGPSGCGPYTVTTACGEQSAMASCGGLRGDWTYQLSCSQSCTTMTDPATCEGIVGCAWATPCAGPVDALCVPYPTPFSCNESSCFGQCAEFTVNPIDLQSRDCDGSAALTVICLEDPP